MRNLCSNLLHKFCGRHNINLQDRIFDKNYYVFTQISQNILVTISMIIEMRRVS